MKPTVLLTRPATQNDVINALLVDAGYRVSIVPLLEIRSVDPGHAGRQLAMDLDRYDHIIFISRNSVDHGIACLQQYWPQWPVALRWYAVGASTANRLSVYDVEVIVPERQTSEGLLELEGLSRVDSSKILIVRGVGGRTTLGEALVQRGASVDYLEVYIRHMVMLTREEREALAALRPMVAPVYSGETLEALMANLDENGAGIDLVVPSVRVAEIARSLGFDRIGIAESARDEDMFEATKTMIETGQ